MRIPLLIAPVIAGLFYNTEALGPENFRKLYGEPTMERFAAPSGITVTVQYGPDRLACQILIVSSRLLVEVHSPDSLMSSAGVSRVLVGRPIASELR